MQLVSPATWLARAARATALVLAAVVLHFAAARDAPSTGPSIALEQAQLVFPTAQRVGRFDEAQRAHAVFDAQGERIGYVLTTSPEADDLIGYSGPSNLLVGLSLNRHIQAVALLSSRDTPAHVNDVKEDNAFWRQFENRASEGDREPIEAVSGSTLTSLAMAEGVERGVSGSSNSFRFPEALSVEEVREVFPTARKLEVDAPRSGWIRATDERGELLGYAIRTSPQADNVIGYAGPTEVWAAIDRNQQELIAVRLRKSYDTPDYVDRVRDDERYLAQLAERSPAEWARIDFKQAGIEGVSGATQTSFAVAEGLRRRFAADVESQAAAEAVVPTWRPTIHDAALLLLIIGAMTISFTRLKGNRRLRVAWQIILVAVFGLWLGDLLSLALVSGWARHGLPWRSATGLVALLAVALITPWTTRRQVYCQHLCPHGAVQEWLGRFRRLHWKLPSRGTTVLRGVPLTLLFLAFVLAITAPRFDLSQLEPFDAWALRTKVFSAAAVATTCIAVAGLLVSLFIPMGYCRFGCPTGALLKLVQSHAVERFRWRDGLALSLLLLSAAYIFWPTSLFSASDETAVVHGATEFNGRAFGTTWNVKLRSPAASSLQHVLDEELERIESRLSHWRDESEVAQFNGSRTTLAMEMSPESLQLLTFANQLSEATDGAYDVTIAPLIDAWGFGPSGPQQEPTDDKIASLLAQSGWRNLTIDLEEGTLRKKKPRLRIDLGSLLQGYAADQLAERLDARGVNEYLIEVGGELRARGAWQVAIENPADPARTLQTLTLDNAALAVSGVYRSAGHILDPHTGRPTTAHWRLVAVTAPTCLQADGWATALLASSDQAESIAEQQHLAVLLQSTDGTVKTSAAWPE